MRTPTIARSVIAAAMAAALAACGGPSAEPEPDPAPAPSPAPSPAPDASPAPGSGDLAISISPRSGSHGTEVTLRASGFEPDARVGVGIGPPQSEYDIIDHVTADHRGEVVTTLTVPNWTEVGRDYLFVAKAPDGNDVISPEFRVTDAHSDGVTRVIGELTDEGVECPALRADDGTLYTLAGDTGPFENGDRVQVEGRVSQMSICMQGTTLEVERISRVQ